MDCNVIVCGGTFDHFHKGHDGFLKYALSLSRKLIIGVTSDKFVRRWKIDDRSWNQIETLEERKKSILEFVKKEDALDRTEIVKIDDLFGNTLSKDLAIDAIVVSNETKKGADIINQRRAELDLPPLKIFIAPPVEAQDHKLISSARIRNGEIDRKGKLYIKPEWLKTDLVLPENLRKEFQKPFGTLSFDVSKHQNKFSWVVSVGDVTTKKFNKLNIEQNISVVDFKVARKKAFSSFGDLGFSKDETTIIVDNPAGHITHNLFLKVLDIFSSGFDKRIILKIEGEEDLAVLPLILAAPLGTTIYYGQPDKGLVKIIVSEEDKEKVYNLASKFKPIEARTRGY